MKSIEKRVIDHLQWKNMTDRKIDQFSEIWNCLKLYIMLRFIAKDVLLRQQWWWDDNKKKK